MWFIVQILTGGWLRWAFGSRSGKFSFCNEVGILYFGYSRSEKNPFRGVDFVGHLETFGHSFILFILRSIGKIIFRGMESRGHSEFRNLFCVVYPHVSMSKFICVDDYLSLCGSVSFSRGSSRWSQRLEWCPIHGKSIQDFQLKVWSGKGSLGISLFLMIQRCSEIKKKILVGGSWIP